MSEQPQRIAIVTPWFGAGLIGGAERLSWDLAHALSRARRSVDVLTTTCRSFHDDWSANYHRPGVTREGEVTIRRFRVDTRDRVAFSRANSALLALRGDELRRDRPPLPGVQTDAFVRESIRSRALLRHLEERGSSYGAAIFLPYLYGTTLMGLPLVADRAFLLPCLHDEAYAYLDAVRECFRAARGLLFNSEGERYVAASLYGPWVHARSTVIGHAVDVVAPPAEPIAIHGFVPQRSRYVLFLGRGDRTKNIDLALDALQRFRAMRRTSSLQLVIAGPHAASLRGDGVVDLGAVTEEEKAALIASARALVQPSTNESFSRTVHEAWQLRRPVVVHADCAATAELVAECGGGWIARSADEWANVFATIDESSDTLVDGLGMRGRAVALRMGTWDDVASRTIAAIQERLAQPAQGPAVSLEQWAGPRPEAPSYDDGALNVVSLAPLAKGDTEGLTRIIGSVKRKARAVRLFVFDEDAAPQVRDELARSFAAAGLATSLVVVGDDVPARYAALRDAHVACAFGSALVSDGPIRQAMWFDVPIVAYDDAIARELVRPCGIVCDRSSPETAAALLALVATDAELRRSVVSEARRIRALPTNASVRSSR